MKRPQQSNSFFSERLVSMSNTSGPGENQYNTLIRVDRSIKPVYPEWVKGIVHPELEGVGPAEYDMTQVELWLHDDQRGDKGYVVGRELFEYLQEGDILKRCLGLDDALAIQKNGKKAFERVFIENGCVLFWRSVIQDSRDQLVVPYISIYDDYRIYDDYKDPLEVGWTSVDDLLDRYRHAACFPNVVMNPILRTDVVGSPLSGNFGP